ncbi:plectin [Gracilaria domingensis]|nr:plectin [Gracilaria domingensis]
MPPASLIRPSSPASRAAARPSAIAPAPERHRPSARAPSPHPTPMSPQQSGAAAARARARSRASSSSTDASAVRRPPSRAETVYFDAVSSLPAAAGDGADGADAPRDPFPAAGASSSGERPPWGWDYVFVFRLPRALKRRLAEQADAQRDEHNERDDDEEDNEDGKSAERVQQRVEILARLSSAGFVFSQLLVASEQLIFLRLSLPAHALKQAAKHVGMELRLKPEFGGGYLEFEPARADVYVNHELEKSTDCYFAPADRSLLILNVLQSKEHWGCVCAALHAREAATCEGGDLEAVVEPRARTAVPRNQGLSRRACDVLLCVCELLRQTAAAARAALHPGIRGVPHGAKSGGAADRALGVCNRAGALDHVLFGELEEKNGDGEYQQGRLCGAGRSGHAQRLLPAVGGQRRRRQLLEHEAGGGARHGRAPGQPRAAAPKRVPGPAREAQRAAGVHGGDGAVRGDCGRADVPAAVVPHGDCGVEPESGGGRVCERGAWSAERGADFCVRRGVEIGFHVADEAGEPPHESAV